VRVRRSPERSRTCRLAEEAAEETDPHGAQYSSPARRYVLAEAACANAASIAGSVVEEKVTNKIRRHRPDLSKTD
jgi:hypothetical protein